MKILKEIFHKENLKLDGRTIYREAIRGIIIKDKKILMIYSPINKDYKFPGGGVDEDESYEETLIREVLEESGATVSQVVAELGKVIEYNKPKEEEFDLFKMASIYYICSVQDGEFAEQNLDDYEGDLKFMPIWIDIDIAIKNNKEIIENNVNVPRWTDRDTFVLELLKEKYL